MSIFHDPWLIQQFEKITKPIVKNAQQNPLLNLLNNLENELHSANALSPDNMQDLPAFIKYLADNSINNIVLSSSSQPPNEDYELYAIQNNSLIPTTIQNDSSYWINVDLLKNYLITLQSNNSLKNNPKFQYQLLKLIQQTNQVFDVNIKEKYQDTSFHDDQVDWLPQLLSLTNWNTQGQIPLLLSNLQSPETLNEWFGTNNIQIEIKNQPTTIKDINWNACIGLQVLDIRANALVQRATPKSKQLAQAYLSAVQKLAQQTNCNIASNNNFSNNNSSNNQTSQPILEEQLTEINPFNVNYIDFKAISEFVDKYAAWRQDPQINQLKDQVHDNMNIVNNLLSSPGTPIQISNITANQFVLKAKDPKFAPSLAKYLYNVVSISGSIFEDFLAIYQRKYGPGASETNKLKQQIGYGGPQQTNLQDLQDLMNHLK